jgi:hypothetical protein
VIDDFTFGCGRMLLRILRGCDLTVLRVAVDYHWSMFHLDVLSVRGELQPARTVREHGPSGTTCRILSETGISSAHLGLDMECRLGDDTGSFGPAPTTYRIGRPLPATGSGLLPHKANAAI